MKYIYILVYIALLFSSCKSVEQDVKEDFKFPIKMDNPTKKIDFGDLVQSYKYVQLETDSNSLVGEIKKILVSGNNLIILSDGVLCFDMQGKHVYSINKKGRGPSEFIQATDMSIDKNLLYLYDNYQYKMMIFDLKTGNFLESFRLNFSAKEIQVSGTTLFCNRGSIPNPGVKSSNQLLVTDRYDQEKISSFIPIDTPYLTISNQFYGSNNQYYWLNPIFNKVYKIIDGKPTPYLRLDFGSKGITREEFAKNPPLSTFSSNGKAFFLSSCFETDQLIYSQLQVGEDPLDVWINKKTKSATYFAELGKKPYQFKPGAQCVANNSFYKIIPVLSANYMKFDMQEKHFIVDPRDPDYENYKIIKDFKESNNPVLAIFQMKL